MLRPNRPQDGFASAEHTSENRLADLLHALWYRRFVFALVFCLISGAIAVRLLLADPVYSSRAVLQIEGENQGGGVLADLKALGSPSSTETEIEIMRSRTVAMGAFALLSQSDFLHEKNAHRPLESIMRAIDPDESSCSLEIETEPLSGDIDREAYEFHFASAPTGALVVVKLREATWIFDSSEATEETVPAFESGVPFLAHGRQFTLTTVEGDPSGRQYSFTLRSPRAGAIWIQKHLEAGEIGRQTGIVELNFEAVRPALAKAVATALARSFVALKQEHRQHQATAALAFLEKESERAATDLESKELALDQYRSNSSVLLLSQRAEWLVQKTSELQLERAETQVILKQLELAQKEGTTEGALRSVLAVMPNAVPSERSRLLTAQLLELQARERALLGEGFLDPLPELKKARAEIAGIRGELQAGFRSEIAGVTQQLNSKIQHINETLKGFEVESQTLPETERKLVNLQRDMQASTWIMEFLERQRQEAQLAVASTLGSARIIDTPDMPEFRSSPNLQLQGLIGLLVAAFMAVLAVIGLEKLRPTVSTPEELSALTGLSVISVLPRLKRRLIRRKASGLVVRNEPGSAQAEAYRALRASLRFAASGKPVRTVTIASALPNEGKTTTAYNLALAAADGGERTLLIDYESRRPSVHTFFSNAISPGLSDVLMGKTPWRDALQDGPIPNLSLLCAGSVAENPSALFTAAGVKKLLEEASEDYDFIVVDVPPVLAVADASSLFSLLDGVLFLTRNRTCAPSIVVSAYKRLKWLDANLFGAVFNCGRTGRVERAASSYYGARPEVAKRVAVEVLQGVGASDEKE